MVVEADIMKLLVYILPVLILLSICSFFISGNGQINSVMIEEFAKYMENPLVNMEEIEVYDFGDHWIWNLIETPINVIVELGYNISAFFVAIVNSVWAITKVIGL